MCGIVGVIRSDHAAAEVHQALLMLQHRGQDSVGILSADDTSSMFFQHKGLGQVSQVFKPEDIEKLKGSSAIGHTRYSTVGAVKEADIQPMATSIPVGIGLVHNGNVSNYDELRSGLVTQRYSFLSGNDLELFLQKIAEGFYSRPDKSKTFSTLKTAVDVIQGSVEGGYSVLGVIAGEGMFGFRDSHGIRPLILGKRKNHDGSVSYCFTSETCALKFLGYEYDRDLKAGELVWIPSKGELISVLVRPKQLLPCMFEWVYFSGADSTFEGMNVYQVRLKLGEALSERIPKNLQIDVVAPVPDTSRPAAIALAEKLGLPFREVLIKNRYVQRSFIVSGQAKRQLAVSLKFSVIDELVHGKNVLLVDDSIVRGTTSRKIVELLRHHGAKSVYIASTCPPIKHPCFYGIDFPSRKELIANNRETSEVADLLKADGVFYTTLEDLGAAIGKPFCNACLTGEYAYPPRYKEPS